MASEGIAWRSLFCARSGGPVRARFTSNIMVRFPQGILQRVDAAVLERLTATGNPREATRSEYIREAVLDRLEREREAIEQAGAS
jgi:metal-responsive CopG/Arc/MetJ family transcriptional regulator